MSYLNIKNVEKSFATEFYHAKGSCRLRIALNDTDKKMKIVAKNHFILYTVFVEKFLNFFFRIEKKWAKIYIENGNKKTPILINIKSLCHRTLLNRKDVLALSTEELSVTLANPAKFSWEYKKLNELFPHITMINLDRVPERIDSFKEHLEVIGEQALNYKRLSAVDGKTLPSNDIEKMSKSDYATRAGKDDRMGRYACYLSHLNALKDARDRKLPQILILEDDVRFTPQELTGPDLQKTLQELPNNWGMLFLGCQDLSPRKAKNYSEHLIQPGCPYDLHAYVVNASMYDQFIAILEKELKKDNGQMRALDVVVAEDVAQKLASEKRIFACKTNVAFQDEGFSSILNKTYTNYNKELKAYKKTYQIDNPNRTFTADGLPIMKPKIAGALYQMADNLSSVFDKHKIRYWADGGTVLGLIRHGGLIPHDDDIDFSIFPDDIKKLKTPEIKEDLKKVGLEIVDHWLGAKICALESHPDGVNMKMDGYTFKTPNIDLFFTKESTLDGKKTYIYSEPRAAKIWPHFIYYHDTIFDPHGKVQKKKFGPIQINTLSDAGALDLCKRIYGKNCMSEIYVQYDHIHERGLTQKPIQLTDYRLGSYKEWDKLPPLPKKP